MDNEQRGRELIRRMFGEDVWEAIDLEGETPFAPLRKWTIRWVYGEIWNRSVLGLRDRSLCTIAALTVLDTPRELRHHVRAGIENGLDRREIAEVIMQMAVYGGWPAAVNALGVVEDLLRGSEVDPDEDSDQASEKSAG